MQFFNCAPRRVTNALAVYARRNKKKIEIAAFTVHFDNDTADRPAVLHDPVRFTPVNGILNRLTGDDLSVLFKVIVPASEFLQCTEVERVLIIQDKLIPVIVRQRYKCYAMAQFP